MPLKNKKSVSKNISELISKKPSKQRQKAISSIAKKQKISRAQAKRKQAIAIALSAAKK